MFEKRYKFSAAAAVLLLCLVMFAPLKTEAAWAKNSNGTYSYYLSNGKKAVNRWIGTNYYVNGKGVRQTGFMYKGKKWYFFDPKGRLMKNTWLSSSTSRYFCGKDGVLYASGRYKIGKYYYGFNARGKMLTGMQTFKKKTYFFNKSTGRMVAKKWVKSGDASYYFSSSGAMLTSRWVGRYYVGEDGKRLTNTWKDEKYLGSDGKTLSGLQEIEGSYYYFNTKDYKKITSQTVTVGNVTYYFDSTGVGTPVSNSKIPATKVNVETTYYTDEYADDETLLAAIIYCESGNQSFAGQQAVGMVIMNRVYSSLFPDTIREVVYAKMQFEPARLAPTHGASLTRALRYPDTVTESCKLAAKTVLKKYENYQEGKKLTLKLSDEKKIAFPFLFFMTKPAYIRLGLKSDYTQIGDHVFFTTWKK